MTEVEMNGASAGWAARYFLFMTAPLLCISPTAVEGWIIIVTNLNEEATEEDLQDTFGEFGEIKNLSMALNRRTGYVMGYALIEYALKEEAENAVKGTDGTTFLEKTIKTDFAFSKEPANARRADRRALGRDRSPERR